MAKKEKRVCVRFLTAVSSLSWGSFGAGEVGEIPADTAKRYIAKGIVEAWPKEKNGRRGGIETPEDDLLAGLETPEG